MNEERQKLYEQIEKLLEDDATKAEGAQVCDRFTHDPRDMLMIIIDQLRNCAHQLIIPLSFRDALLRVAALAVAGLQWSNKWIAEMEFRNKQNQETIIKPQFKIIQPENHE